ncbi:MAG: hypothetical protein ACRDMI_16105 [Streptosporangiaceae bacterium]
MLPETGGHPAGQRTSVSRRAMLRTAAGASAASLVAGGAFAALPAAAAARSSRSQTSADRTGRSAASTTQDAAAHPGREADGPLVIHVRDARTGEMDVFAGTTRTRLRDPELAARLARASR